MPKHSMFPGARTCLPFLPVTSPYGLVRASENRMRLERLGTVSMMECPAVAKPPAEVKNRFGSHHTRNLEPWASRFSGTLSSRSGPLPLMRLERQALLGRFPSGPPPPAALRLCACGTSLFFVLRSVLFCFFFFFKSEGVGARASPALAASWASAFQPR